ncbi:MAG: hypothetical protein NTV32_09460 [Gammaproteobacteria bacterium]|nr:hypothetical protein [Gammaproteobacteria bacterium]
MKYAYYGSPEGPLVTPEAFIIKASVQYKKKGIYPYCPACGKALDLYGVHTPLALSRFDHKNLEKNILPEDDCILANRNSRFKGLIPDGFDRARGIELREAFFEDENLKIAYAFCWKMCRQGNLPAERFKKLIERADKHNIWAYSNLPLWITPYILLTFGDFMVAPKDNKKGYTFQFIFNKPRATTISSLWLLSEQCSLMKVFVKSGDLVKLSDNPYPLSKEALFEKAGNIDWIKKPLLNSLMLSETPAQKRARESLVEIQCVAP